MAVDLHTHSRYSDGSASPADLVGQASQIGLTALALTDHDTLEGVPEAREEAERLDIELIPGTELSLEHPTGGMHLVVLWLEPGRGPLQDRLTELQEGRLGRNEAMCAELTRLGMPLTIEEVTVEAGSGTVGRPHIAGVMVRKGYVPDIRTAFDLWIGNAGPAYTRRKSLTPEEGIGLAVASGGVPILAHPHTLAINRASEMADLLDRLKSFGLAGIEAHYSGYRQHERYGYSDLARRFGLLPSGGSDYHGEYKVGLELGSGYGDLHVPDEILESLAEARQ